MAVVAEFLRIQPLHGDGHVQHFHLHQDKQHQDGLPGKSTFQEKMSGIHERDVGILRMDIHGIDEPMV